jgi:hypothetical protein
MAAAPQYGTMIFTGLRSRRIYNVDIYGSDVADGLLNFDGGAGASSSSPLSYTAGEPIVLTDFAIVTGMTDTTKIQVLRNNQPVGDFLRYAMHLTTLSNRAEVRVGFNQGVEIRAIQKA